MADQLSVGLRTALKALLTMLDYVQPLFIPHALNEQWQAVVFADAYVRSGEVVYKAGHITQDVRLPQHTRDNNGWGYVVRIGTNVFYSHSQTPKSVLDQITSRKALIYALEVYAQLMAVLTLANRLPNDWLAFIENTAGEAALFVNSMLAAFWGTAARRGWRPILARVESKANVADAVSRGDYCHVQGHQRAVDTPGRPQRRDHRHPHSGSRGRRLRGGSGGERAVPRHKTEPALIGCEGRRAGA